MAMREVLMIPAITLSWQTTLSSPGTVGQGQEMVSEGQCVDARQQRRGRGQKRGGGGGRRGDVVGVVDGAGDHPGTAGDAVFALEGKGPEG